MDFVEKFPYLYMKDDPSYHDANMKENSWKTISKETGLNGNVLKNAWRALRDQFSRYLRALDTPSGSAPVKAGTFNKFRFADRMTYLKGHISQRKTAGNIGDEEESLPGSPINTEVDSFVFSEEELVEALNDDSLNSENQKQVVAPGIKRKNISFTPVQRKKRDTEFKYEKELISILKEQKEEDEYDHYCMSLAPRMRTFSKKQYATAKIKIEKFFGIEFPDA